MQRLTSFATCDAIDACLAKPADNQKTRPRSPLTLKVQRFPQARVTFPTSLHRSLHRLE